MPPFDFKMAGPNAVHLPAAPMHAERTYAHRLAVPARRWHEPELNPSENKIRRGR
jgi:hypothetical protein